MIDYKIAIGWIFGTDEYQANTELVTHQQLEFFLIGGHITIFLDNSLQLIFATLILEIILSTFGLDKCLANLLLNHSSSLDDNITILFVTLIAKRFEDSHILRDGCEGVFESFGSGLPNSFILTLLQQPVDNILRASTFMVVVYLLSIRSHTAGNDMDMVIVCVVVGIDEHGLALLTIAHFVHVTTGEADQLLMSHLVAFTGESYMELRLLDSVILSWIVVQKRYQVFGRIFTHVADVAEV